MEHSLDLHEIDATDSSKGMNSGIAGEAYIDARSKLHMMIPERIPVMHLHCFSSPCALTTSILRRPQ